MKILLIITSVLAVPFLLLFQVAMIAANGWATGLVWFAFQVAVVASVRLAIHLKRRYSRYAALAARADYENGALLRGDDVTGVFGQFPPSA